MNRRLKLVVIAFSFLLVSALLAGAMASKTASPEETYRHMGVFSEVLSRIKSEYVEEPNMGVVNLGAINGLLESLDPYASYMSADQYKQYQREQNSKKASVGLRMAKRYSMLSIIDAVPMSPAAKAGLGTGDMVEAINGVSTRDMPLAYADIMLQGEAGSNVELTVLRFRKPEPQKITLVRAAIVFLPVTVKMLDNNIGHIRATSLSDGKVAEIASAVQSLAKQGAKKMVLDLRHCAYGSPTDGIALANLFMDKGTISYLVGQKNARQNFEADSSKQIWKDGLVVITNRGTASGAEVAAAALMDSKRAEVVGERTYGDAGLRKALTMDDGGAVILTVAKYYSPSGKAIQDNAVMPSVPLLEQLEPQASEDEEEPPATVPATIEPKKNTEDELLKKAIEVLVKGKPPLTDEQAKTVADGQKKLGKEADSAPELGPLHIPKK